MEEQKQVSIEMIQNEAMLHEKIANYANLILVLVAENVKLKKEIDGLKVVKTETLS
jgi:hypothetical protein